MLIELKHLEPDGQSVHGALDPRVFADARALVRRDERVADPLRAEVDARVWPEGRHVRVRGEVRGQVRLECDRCLTPVTLDIVAPFDVPFTWGPPGGPRPPQQGVETALTGSDLDVGSIEGSVLDVGEVAREQFELRIPLRAVCSDECAGLCPTCGADRNRVECGCRETVTDTRWDALKGLAGTDGAPDSSKTKD